MPSSLVGLLDCNNFYVSCERIFRPDLQNRPVVVLSNNDGCIIARSNEVKNLGVPMGVPYFKVRKLLEAHHTAIFSSHFGLYGDISSRVMSIVESLAPRIEVYSIDEVFIELTGVPDPEKLAHHIRFQVLKQVGIPTCIGIASTKTLSKIANHVAKKNPSYQGVCLLQNSEIDATLQTMALRDIWGIGRKSAEKLTLAGVTTGLQLKNVDPKWMRRRFTVTGERLVLELNGIQCLELEDFIDQKKSMQVTRTFSQGIKDYLLLREKIASFAARIGQKLRQHQLAASTITVFVRTNPHHKNNSFYKNGASLSLPFPANDDFTLIKACTQIFNTLYRANISIHRAGVCAYDLVTTQNNAPLQLNLFEKKPSANPKSTALMSAMDRLNSKFGRGTVSVASCGLSRHRKDNTKYTLEGNQLKKSPAYTTRWSDLLVVH